MLHLSWLQAAVIGAMQGVTELFPVSSLGHAVLFPHWVGWGSLANGYSGSDSGASSYLAFIIALHCATALALLVFYWRTWIRVIGAFFTSVIQSVKERRLSITTPTQRLAWLIVVATIPAGILGLVLEHELRTVFANKWAAATLLMINAFVLIAGERLRRKSPAPTAAYANRDEEQEAIVTTQVSLRDAAVIGTAQTGALLAGISRSGITMVGGLLRGLDHETAVNFSFLLATPIIAAAGVLKIPSLFSVDKTTGVAPIDGNGGAVLLGSAVAFVIALASIKFLTKYFEKRSLYPFAAYCFVAGSASLIGFAVS